MAATAAGHHLVVPFRRPVTTERWLPGAAERLSSGLTSAVDLRRLGYGRKSPRMAQVAAEAGWPIRRVVRGGRRRLGGRADGRTFDTWARQARPRPLAADSPTPPIE